LIKKGINVSEIKEKPIYNEIMRMRLTYSEADLDKLEALPKKIEDSLQELDF
jgi:hypothetical protein